MQSIQVSIESIGPIRLSSEDSGLSASFFNTGAPIDIVVTVESDGELLYDSVIFSLGRLQTFETTFTLRSPDNWRPSNRRITVSAKTSDGRVVGSVQVFTEVIPYGWVDTLDPDMIKMVCSFYSIGSSDSAFKGSIGEDLSDIYDDLSSITSVIPDDSRYVRINGFESVADSCSGSKLDIAGYTICSLLSSGHDCLLIHLYNDYIVGIKENASHSPDYIGSSMFFNPLDACKGVPLSVSMDRTKQIILNNMGILKEGRDWSLITANKA